MSPNGLFVAVGSGDTAENQIGTSTDGLNWQVAANVSSLFSLGEGSGIAYGLVNGVGTFVAVGQSSTGSADQIGTSTDGLKWQVAADVGNLFRDGEGHGVAYGVVNGVGTFVAVGQSANGSADQIGTSTDGLNWTAAANVGSLFRGGGLDAGRGIAYGAGTFVAVGRSANGGVDSIGISMDGLNWQVAADVGSLFSGGGVGLGIAYGAGTFVAVGSSENGGVDNIGTSTDGLNWQVAASVGSLFSTGGTDYVGAGRAIAYGLINGVGTFVAVGESENGGVDNIGISTDGLNWQVAADVGSLFSGGGGGYGRAITYGLVNGVGTFVAVGTSANGDAYNIGTSTDGLKWQVAADVGNLFRDGKGRGITYGEVTPTPTPTPTPKPKEITAPMTCTIKATINLNFN
jgi:hypothetical protein